MRDAAADLLREACNVSVSDKSSCVKLVLDEKECAGSAWLLKTAAGAFCIFLDAESEEVDDSDADGYAKSSIATSPSLPQGGNQAKHFAQLCELAAEREKADPFSLIGAMQAKNYLYVHLNTKRSSSFFGGDNVLNLGGEDSAKFLSFIYDYYVLHQHND